LWSGRRSEGGFLPAGFLGIGCCAGSGRAIVSGLSPAWESPRVALAVSTLLGGDGGSHSGFV